MTGERNWMLICSIHTQPVIAGNKTCQTGQIYGVETWEIHLPGHTMWYLSPGSKRYQPHLTELTATHICEHTRDIRWSLLCFDMAGIYCLWPVETVPSLYTWDQISTVPYGRLVPIRQEVVFVAEAEGFCRFLRNLAQKRNYWFDFEDAEGNSMIKHELRCLSGWLRSISRTTDKTTMWLCTVQCDWRMIGLQ